MKRITTLEIENFRAFFGHYKIEMSKGENLLIYGENGSGKSSLFKSVSNFLNSSRNTTLLFVKHHNRPTEEGNLNFTFQDYNFATHEVIPGTDQVIQFCSNAISTNAHQFLKDSELIKGFLDYRSLLEVYNHREPTPNLFELIISQLLKNYTPIASTYAIGQKYQEIKTNLETVFSRDRRIYRTSVAQLPQFEATIRATLNRIFKRLNLLLIKYFKLNLRVWYSLNPLNPVNPNARNGWRRLNTSLRLEVKLNGVLITNQMDYLNEARLSALSICLYLSALLESPQAIDYKTLFLDDIFIGLDTTNRLPILKIIQEEFKEHQIFISTYDRHLYELAKRKFENETPGKWKSVELYVGKDLIGNQPIEKPILVVGESNFEKGSQYLHDRKKPDYPAAANYFRKALEELIQDFIPKWETADAENTQLPDYQLTQLTLRAKRFLEYSNNDTSEINRIITLLPALLHPLSHHEITSPVYKGELISIENSYPRLKQQLINLDIPNNFRCCLGSGKHLKLTFEVDAATNHYCYYEIILKSPLTMRRNGAANPTISKVGCVAEKCYGVNGTTPYPNINLPKKNPAFNYESLSAAYDRIHTHLISTPIGSFPRVPDYLTTVQYHDGTGWQPLSSIIVW